MYEAKEAKLLEAMYTYTAEVIDDGFLKMYKQIRDQGLEPFVTDALKAAEAEVVANRKLITDKTLNFDELLGILQLYIGLSENVALQVKRAETRQILEKVLKSLQDVAALKTDVVFTDNIPQIVPTVNHSKIR